MKRRKICSRLSVTIRSFVWSSSESSAGSINCENRDKSRWYIIANYKWFIYAVNYSGKLGRVSRDSSRAFENIDFEIFQQFFRFSFFHDRAITYRSKSIYLFGKYFSHNLSRFPFIPSPCRLIIFFFFLDFWLVRLRLKMHEIFN